MPSTPEPLFLPDPDSPLFQFLCKPTGDPPTDVWNPPEPEDQGKPKASLGSKLKGRREVYVLLPRRVRRAEIIEETPAPSLSDTIEALGRTLDRKWDEEDLPYIINIKKALFVIDAQNALLTR